MITTIIAASVSTACALWAIRSAWINNDLKDELRSVRSHVKLIEARKEKLNSEVFHVNCDMWRQAETIESLRQELIERHEEATTFGLSRLTFDAVKPDGTIHHTDFKLGLGPCGKTVEWLTWEPVGDQMYLTQYHTDGSLKRFKFYRTDIVGREVEQMEALKLRKGSRAYRDLKGYVSTPGGGYEKGMSFKEWNSGKRRVFPRIL